ncbi:hypothetical protein WMF43_23530 [Sorangium sp. So ce131]
MSRTLRVERCRSRAPSASSSSATERLTEDFGSPSALAAAVKPCSSTTRTKTAMRL